MRASTVQLILAVLLLTMLASGCADANLAEDNLEMCAHELSGFLWGLWHGFIAPISFVGSLFKDDIAIYDICNTGGWYDFGYCLGIGAFSKGSHSAAKQSPWPSGSKDED